MIARDVIRDKRYRVHYVGPMVKFTFRCDTILIMYVLGMRVILVVA